MISQKYLILVSFLWSIIFIIFVIRFNLAYLYHIEDFQSIASSDSTNICSFNELQSTSANLCLPWMKYHSNMRYGWIWHNNVNDTFIYYNIFSFTSDPILSSSLRVNNFRKFLSFDYVLRIRLTMERDISVQYRFFLSFYYSNCTYIRIFSREIHHKETVS